MTSFDRPTLVAAALTTLAAVMAAASATPTAATFIDTETIRISAQSGTWDVEDCSEERPAGKLCAPGQQGAEPGEQEPGSSGKEKPGSSDPDKPADRPGNTENPGAGKPADQPGQPKPGNPPAGKPADPGPTMPPEPSAPTPETPEGGPALPPPTEQPAADPDDDVEIVRSEAQHLTKAEAGDTPVPVD